MKAGYVRYAELRPVKSSIELWVFDIEDIGHEEYLDIYDFPYLESTEPLGPMSALHDASAAMADASQRLGADASRWTNQGVAQSDYGDFIRLGRPARWP